MSLLLYLLVVLSPASIAQGSGVHLKIFHGRGAGRLRGVSSWEPEFEHLKVFNGKGSLKAEYVSSWEPELDPKSLGDTNVGEIPAGSFDR